jgi:HEAT repeat protein
MVVNQKGREPEMRSDIYFKLKFIGIVVAGAALVSAGVYLLWSEGLERDKGQETQEPASLSDQSPRHETTRPSDGATRTSRSGNKDSGDSDGRMRRTQPEGMILSDEERLAILLGSKSDGSYDSRFVAAQGLSSNLTTESIQGLYSLLKSGERPEGIRTDQWYALQNEVMNKLRQQEPLPVDLAQVLCSIFQDSSLEPGTRDYAVQHVSLLFPKATGESDRQLMEQTLQVALSDPQQGLKGTALVAMHRIPKENSERLHASLLTQAAIIASNEAIDPASRTTAMGICAERGGIQVLPVAVRLAHSSPSFPLRLASIHAIGKLGNYDHVATLNELHQSKQEAVSNAAKIALKLLRNRLEKQS